MGFISFPQTASAPRQVFGEGSLTSDICIVGEAPSHHEVASGRPFIGPAGQLLNECMHQAKIIRAQCYVTNFIKEQLPPKKGDKKPIEAFVTNKGRLTEKGRMWQERLAEELSHVKANIVVALGAAATAALAPLHPVSERRGYISRCYPMFQERKIIPTFHPASCLYGGNYINKFYIIHDLEKAKLHSNTPEVVYDPDISYRAPQTISELRAALKPFMECDIVSFDIEVSNFEMSCISFASNDREAVVIDLYDRDLWTESEELEIYSMINQILSNPESTKVGQNLIFDIQFLISRYHIHTRGPIVDTMVGHSLIYPDFLKGLGFLGSIYANVPYWKDMLKQHLTKREG